MGEVIRLGELSYEQLDELAADPSIALCWAHGVAEPCPPDAYLICAECGHVFATEQDLLDAHNAGGWLYRATFGSQVYACPECAHDF